MNARTPSLPTRWIQMSLLVAIKWCTPHQNSFRLVASNLVNVFPFFKTCLTVGNFFSSLSCAWKIYSIQFKNVRAFVNSGRISYMNVVHICQLFAILAIFVYLEVRARFLCCFVLNSIVWAAWIYACNTIWCHCVCKSWRKTGDTEHAHIKTEGWLRRCQQQWRQRQRRQHKKEKTSTWIFPFHLAGFSRFFYWKNHIRTIDFIWMIGREKRANMFSLVLSLSVYKCSYSMANPFFRSVKRVFFLTQCERWI